MAVSIPAEAPASVSDPRQTVGSTLPAVVLVTRAVVVAASLIVIGLIWDIAWHRSVGRDTFWSPPHMVEYAAAVIVGLSCGWLILRTTFAGSAADRAAMVRFWGFYGPLGAWVSVWGALSMLTSAPFDDWWHNAYGLDVKIVSPPHMLLLTGMLAIVTGAMLMALARQNRSAVARNGSGRWSYAYAAGLLVLLMATATFEYTAFPNLWHGKMFYRVSAAVFPFALAFAARTGRLSWPATATAGCFMLASLVLSWTLQMVPATPRLAPIQNPITHLVPAPFPILLIVPALGFDLLYRRWGERGDWKLSLMLGVVFVLLFAGASWPAAEFLLSPPARNPVFLADQWDYTARLGPWRYEFWDSVWGRRNRAEPQAPGVGVLVAVLLAFGSARLGLWWGRWMRQVKR
ncbi:MAG TPA: hypothetical protein VFO95_12925 [Gemmatimonadales bacterium]|nr:hypothetical protein [Gemmatimonadales bacterium]